MGSDLASWDMAMLSVARLEILLCLAAAALGEYGTAEYVAGGNGPASFDYVTIK
ncbi:hypothetical protein OHT76_19205 [Streptomyces sp. NBC_00287]|uniref:hypothetical protein n=1 Tax=Streptomyces sp. NBC_00287 TaxID=2975702 RepID=UPI002E29D4FF|nr:hypothetical protein [Streptomyces sp. NBC_00287]